MPPVSSSLRHVQPAQPSLSETPPAGDGWIHEIKFDGYRTQIIIDRGADGRRVRAFTRRGLDWTHQYASIVAAAGKLDCGGAIIDGEVILPDERGASDFHGLRRAITREQSRLVFVAFDLLHLDGEDLRQLPIEERRGRLRRLLKSAPTSCITFSEAFEVEGADAFAAVERLGLEGIISKRRASRYRSGNTPRWIKTKTFTTGAFDIIGADQSDRGLPLALLAANGPAGPQYMGSAILTLPAPARDRFWRFVEKNPLDRAPVKGLKQRGVWVRPGLTATVRHLRGEAMLRHATVLDLAEAR